MDLHCLIIENRSIVVDDTIKSCKESLPVDRQCDSDTAEPLFIV